MYGLKLCHLYENLLLGEAENCFNTERCRLCQTFQKDKKYAWCSEGTSQSNVQKLGILMTTICTVL